jgi:uncharacterized protein YdbL (DUF1318 family)
MYSKAAIALILLVGTMSSGLASPPQNALAVAMRAATSQGLFAEEYEAILEAAQDDPELRKKIVEHLTELPK